MPRRDIIAAKKGAQMKALPLTSALVPLLAVTMCFAQTTAAPSSTPSPKLSFEVASVKASAPLDAQKLVAQLQSGNMPRFGASVEGDRANYTYMTLKDLIALAYGVKTFQITGPEWLASDHFDIQAKLPEGTSKNDAPAMLQSLLAERFKLAVHRDTSEHKVLSLIVGKDGPKMKESPAATPIDENAPLQPGETKIPGADGSIRMKVSPDGSMVMNMGSKGVVREKIDMGTMTVHIESTMVTMDGLADMLTSVMSTGGGAGRQVVNQTGLKGNYQVSLDLSMADLLAMVNAQGLMGAGAGGGNAGQTPVPVASDPAGGSSVYKSVENLGLKLEERKAPILQLIVDHVDKTPTEN